MGKIMKALNKCKPRRSITNLAVAFPPKHKQENAARLDGIFARGFNYPATRQASRAKRAHNHEIRSRILKSVTFGIKFKESGTVLLTNNK